MRKRCFFAVICLVMMTAACTNDGPPGGRGDRPGADRSPGTPRVARTPGRITGGDSLRPGSNSVDTLGTTVAIEVGEERPLRVDVSTQDILLLREGGPNQILLASPTGVFVYHQGRRPTLDPVPDLSAWIAGHPFLKISPKGRALVGGIKARVLRFEANAPPSDADCPAACLKLLPAPSPRDAIYLLAGQQGEIYLLPDSAPASIVVVVTDERSAEEFLPRARALLGDLSFDS